MATVLFFEALKSFDVQAKTTAIEFDKTEAGKARSRAQHLDLPEMTVKTGDFSRLGNKCPQNKEAL